MPTAFITGITGQDGGYLAEALLAEGYDVHGLVRLPDPGLAPLCERSTRVVTHEGDLGDAAGLRALVSRLQPDEIYSLGGISSVAFSWEQPVLTAEVTGISLGVLLEAAWEQQQRSGRQVRVLQASSAEIFGVAEQSPQTEQTPIRPINPYGAAKAFAHHLVGVYRARGLHASACILYNHESPRRPDTFVTRKITKAAAMIAAGAPDVLRLGNLDARRDWGWAPDYVDAMRRAVRHGESGDYVIATGAARSVRDFVQAAFTYAGVANWEARVEVDESFVRPYDAHEQVGDASKAKAVLGWAPTVSFAEMVALMVDHDRRAIDSAPSAVAPAARRSIGDVR
jgi:GDPmannose 4,6-dehydratase